MAPEVTDAVRALETLTLEALRSEWRRLYGPAPKLRSVDLLRRLIAWRLQAAADPQAVDDLRARFANTAATTPATGVVGPGARVMREWKGIAHEAEVLEGGKVLYGDDVYDSLSAVARVITGTRWNGPRFFGLRAAP